MARGNAPARGPAEPSKDTKPGLATERVTEIRLPARVRSRVKDHSESASARSPAPRLLPRQKSMMAISVDLPRALVVSLLVAVGERSARIMFTPAEKVMERKVGWFAVARQCPVRTCLATRHEITRLGHLRFLILRDQKSYFRNVNYITLV